MRFKGKINKKSFVLLASILILSMLAVGCSGGNKQSEGNGSPPPASASESQNGGESNTPQPSEPLKFTYLRPVWGPATYTKGGAYEKELFSKANVDIEVQIVPVTEYDQKINTFIASGSIPDVFWATGPSDQKYVEMQQENMFVKINEYLDKYPAVKEAVPESVWEMLKDDKGDIYFIPNLINPVNPIFLFYRQDWFEKWGIAEPKTLAEFEAALEKVKSSDSNMIPLTGQDAFWGLGALGTSFGFTDSGWSPSDEDSNTIVPWFAKKGGMDYQFWLRDLREKGLLDPEFLVAPNWDHSLTKFVTGKAAVLGIYYNYAPQIISTIRKTEPSAKIGILSPLTGFNGEKGGSRTLGVFDRGMYISAKMKDPDGFFRYLNWLVTDGADFRRFGIEGKTFETVDGRQVPIAEDSRENDYKSGQIEPLKFFTPYAELFDWETVKSQFTAEGLDSDFEYFKTKYIEYATNEQYPDYRYPTNISKTEVEKGGQLFSDYLVKVLGSVFVDKNITTQDWMDAVQKWKDAGGAEIIAEVNAQQESKAKPVYSVNP